MTIVDHSSNGSQVFEQLTIENSGVLPPEPVQVPVLPSASDSGPDSTSEHEEKKTNEEARKKVVESAQKDKYMTGIDVFLKGFIVASVLKKCNFVKEKGISPLDMLRFLIASIFEPLSIYAREKLGKLPEGISTSSVSRFLNNARFNWERLLGEVGGKAAQFIYSLTDDQHKKVFVADDSDYDRVPRSRNPKEGMGKPNKKHRKHKGRRTELAGRKYDHARQRHSIGFRMLTLIFTDAVTTIPLAFCLLTNQDKEKHVGDDRSEEFNKNSNAYKRRILAMTDTATVLICLLNRVMKFLTGVKHLCADRWFSDPATILKLTKQTKLHIITLLKQNETKYLFEGKEMTIKQIYKMVRKRPGMARILASITLTVPGKGAMKGQSIEARIVFVRNKAKRKEWLAILCTDMSLTDEDIIEYYSLRWKIECYFNTVKLYLGLKECKSIYYDAITAHVTVVALRYIMLSIEQRKSVDQRTMGALVAFFTEQIKDVDLQEALNILMECFCKAAESVNLTEEQLETFMTNFYNALPPKLRKAMDVAYSKLQSDNDEDGPRSSKNKAA